MTLHIKDWLAAQIDMPPLASTDTDLVLDLDFRTGKTAIEAKLVTAEGLTHTSTGEQWDTTLGWKPGTSGRFYTTAWTPSGTSPSGIVTRAAIGDSFTIHFEVRRQDIASTWVDSNSSLLDCSLGPSGSGTNIYGAQSAGYIFQFANTDIIEAHYNNGAGPTGRFVMDNKDNGVASRGQMALTFNADYLNSEDQFVSIDIVVDKLNEYYYIDGLLQQKYVRTLLANSTADIFKSLRFSDDGSAARGLLGWIRRFQLIRRACHANNFTSPRIAFLGDSYVQRMANQSTPGAQTVAAINAVQTMLDNTLMTTLNNGLPQGFFSVQKQAAKAGARFSFYAAGDAGHGWSSTVGGSNASQIRQGFFDAVGTYDPEILICFGSINDVNNGTLGPQYPTDLVGEIESRLTYVAAQCRNLRKILFLQTFPGHKGLTALAAAGPLAEYKRQIGIQSQLDGYSVTTKDSRTVTVQFVPTYSVLGGDNYNAEFNLGGSVEAPLWDALYTKTETGNDVHPGTYGQNRIAEIVWSALGPCLLNAAMYYS